MKEKMYEVNTRPALETFLKKNINKIKSIDVLQQYRYIYSNNVLSINFLDKKAEGEIHTFEYSKIFVNPIKTVLIYCTDSDNPRILEELDYIHSKYWFANGTTRSFISPKNFSVMIFRNEEVLSEKDNYGSPEKNILLYPGSFDNKNYIDTIISRDTTYEEIATAFESYLSSFNCTFNELSWKKSCVKDILEFVIQVEIKPNPEPKEQISRRYVGSRISGKVLEISYGNEIRIYIGPKSAHYIMRTYGEEILETDNQVITIELFDNSVIEIYQKNAQAKKCPDLISNIGWHFPEFD